MPFADFLLKKYAHIELMLFQNRKKEALDSLQEMLNDFKSSSLTDDILWQEANIETEMGKFEDVIANLKTITDSYGTDVLGDDAMFKMAEIYQYYLNHAEKAEDIYREFLTRYPGSVYISDARKRFRMLRGDMVAQ